MKKIELTGPVGDDCFNIRMVENLPPGQLHILVDSGGGCSTNGFAIYNQLRSHQGKVTVETTRAGSAAVLPLLAGDHRTINGDGWVFIHRAWATTIGTSPTLIKAAESLAEWDVAVAEVYAERTGQPLTRIFELMDAETTLGPAEAVELGFAHEVVGPVKHVTSCRSLDRTALGCLNVEREMIGPVMSELRTAAIPVAAQNTAINHILSKPIPKPKIKVGQEARALEQFCENERRENDIKRGIATRLRGAICQSGQISWPLLTSWTCSSCGETNHGPPARNRLATPCAYCAQTSPEEI